MVQATSSDAYRFSDANPGGTTSGAARGESLSDSFYQEFSTREIEQYHANRRADYADSNQTRSVSVAAILGDMEIVDDGSSSTIWTDKKSDAFSNSSSTKVDHTQHLSRSGWDGSGDARGTFGNQPSSSKFDYEQIQMTSAGGDRVAKAKPGDNPPATKQEATIRNLNDTMTERALQFPTGEEMAKAESIKKDLLAGKDISQAINKLGRDERAKIMSFVKSEIMKTPGTSVVATQNQDGSQDLVFRTKDGAIVHISEDSYGKPTSIQVRGKGWTSALGWATAGGAKTVYESGDAKPTTSGSGGSNPVDYLRREASPVEGNGPLSRARRGEELSDDDWKQLEESSRRSGGRIIIIKPRGVD